MIKKILGFLKYTNIYNGEKSSENVDGFVKTYRLILKDVLVIVIVGGILFSVSGVWPPMVAIESDSMDPNLNKGDLIFLVEENRYGGIETREDVSNRYKNGVGMERYQEGLKFGEYGDVIVFRPESQNQREEYLVIHRAEMWVNEDEDWYDRANPSWVIGKNCDMMENCPAPHSGYITKGDGNVKYDQVAEISEPVQIEWIHGNAKIRIPWLGYVKLFVNNLI